MGWALNLVIVSAWFPRKGKGFFLGIWSANATFGDLVGTQIYKATAQ
jgi:sugar phosphate permease